MTAPGTCRLCGQTGRIIKAFGTCVPCEPRRLAQAKLHRFIKRAVSDLRPTPEEREERRIKAIEREMRDQKDVYQ